MLENDGIAERLGLEIDKKMVLESHELTRNAGSSEDIRKTTNCDYLIGYLSGHSQSFVVFAEKLALLIQLGGLEEAKELTPKLKEYVDRLIEVYEQIERVSS